MQRPRKGSNFQDSPLHLSSYVQHSSTPLILDAQFQTNPSPSPNDNQSVKRRYNSRITTIWSFIKVGFRFQYQLINLVWLSIGFFPFSWSQTRNQNNFKELKTSFSSSSYSEKMCWGQCWAEASLSTFSWLYIFLCAVVQKYHEMLFIYNYSHFLYSFWNQRVLFAQPEGKQTMEQQPHRACEWKKSKQKQNHVTFKLGTRFIVWFSPQTMQWYH